MSEIASFFNPLNSAWRDYSSSHDQGTPIPTVSLFPNYRSVFSLVMILHRLTAADTKHAEVSILTAPPGHGAVYHPHNEGVSHNSEFSLQ
jgi:hypothetical protein